MNVRKDVVVSSNRPRLLGFALAPHHTFTYSTKSNNYQEFRSFIKSSSDPVPVFSINYSGRLMTDPAMATVLQRRKLEADKNILKLRLRKEKLKPNQISGNMIKYIEMSETDPAPLIGMEFDWRFLGGNLGFLKVEDENVLAQSSMCSDYDIRLVKRKSSFDYVDLPFNPKEFNKHYGYELLTCKNLVGVRKKNKFSFKKREDISGDDSCITTPIEYKWTSDIAGCNLTNRDLIFVDVDYNISRVGLKSDFLLEGRVRLPEVEPKHQFPVSVSSFDCNVVTYTNLKKLNMVDFRSSKVCTIFGEENFIMKCEELSYHTRSCHKNVIYLASSHLLYGIDRRMPKKVLMHWNHQMVMQPTMLKTAQFSAISDEVICVSSNQKGDLKIFNCKDIALAPVINWMPYKPRSIGDSYKKLRGKGELLLSETIKHRVDLSVTGIALVKGGINEMELYTQNSIGDIFKTNLYSVENHPRLKLDVSGYFQAWDTATKVDSDALKFASTKELMNHSDLRFTDIVNLKGLASVLRCERLQRNGEETDYGEMKTKMIPRWRVDIEDAKAHKDVLAQYILDEWELEIEESQPPEFAEALLATKHLNKFGPDKVSWWLDNSNIVAEEMEVDELLAEPVSQLPDTQQTATKKPKKASQRIKGF